MTLAHSAIARQRLRSQRLTAAPLDGPADVVRWLVAVQAQDFAGAKWGVGQRMKSATDAVVERAFAEGAILRTHAMRPTWHFVTPEDIRWLLALTAPRVHAVNGNIYRRSGLDPPVFKRSRTVLARALRNGNYLTRDELREALAKSGIPPGDGLRLAYLLMAAELDGLICSGPRRGRQFTYALLEERAPKARRLSRDESLAELAGRFFASRGPASVQDFAKWSGLTIADARRGLEHVKARLRRDESGGQEYWSGGPVAPATDRAPTAHLLSIYDEYISSYKDRSAMGEAEAGPKLLALGNALLYIVVVKGQIVGAFKRTLTKTAVRVETSLFASLTASEKRALALAARRYGEFIELPVVLDGQLD